MEHYNDWMGDAPQEIVLTLIKEPEEVVLSYEAELPGRPSPARPRVQAAPPVPAEKPRKEKKRRRWPWVVLILVGALLLVGLGIAAAYSALSIWENVNRSRPGIDGPYWSDWEGAGDQGVSLPAYPLGGFRIQCQEAQGPALTPQQVYEQVNPSVVAVVTYMEQGGATGTGVILSADGYILTNYHVVEGGKECYILLGTGDYYEAKFVAGDYEKDLAVLKVEPEEELPAAEFGDSDALVVGDTVYAIGNPLGLELINTFTDGIVSAVNRDVDVDGITMTLIQTNAALNSGNSGGPLVNVYGQVVGINTIKMVATEEDDSVEGLGFAIPMSSGSYVVNSLIEFGEVRPEPELGVKVAIQLTVLEDGTGGLEVKEVISGMGAEEAGIQVGDYIVADRKSVV